jgi:hypothetical protein
MTAGKTDSESDPLLAVLRSSLSPGGAPAFGHLILYTSFGVVRGRAGLAFARGLVNRQEGVEAEGAVPPELIELSDATVEHYSNHLAAASFTRLYVKLSDVRGFALVGPPGQ